MKAIRGSTAAAMGATNPPLTVADQADAVRIDVRVIAQEGEPGQRIVDKVL